MSATQRANIATIDNLRTGNQEKPTMKMQTIAVLGVLALALGLGGPASASSFVDIAYDLSDTAFTAPLPACPAAQCVIQQLLGGSMTVRYASNSASSMPIVHGAATLQSLTLQMHAAVIVVTGGTTFTFTSATANINLVSPVAGSLLSSGTLTFGAAQIRVTGTRHCYAPSAFSGVCVLFGGTLTSIFGALGPFTTTGALSLAASAGPNGGAQSTRHTVSGTLPVYAPAKAALVAPSMVFASGANLIGREVLREAPGHDPKVTPEPGTLLLLGAGTAGLVLVGRATRRSREG